VRAPLTGAALQAFENRLPIDFNLKLSFAGQERLSIAPIADQTNASLTSPWPHPAFGGRFLANTRTVSAQGFDAQWANSSLASSARAQLIAAKDGRGEPPADSFNVSLGQPVNVYSLSTRAAKYGALFVGLVLMAAFMFELLRKLRLHSVQYGLVGLSIALFFLLLLALSEKMAFWLAYACGASASVLLLAVYFSAVLKGWRRGVSLGAYVAVLYAALYGLLSSESNALRLGALLLFGLVSLLMIATRRLDWYGLGDSRTDKPSDKSSGTPGVPPATVAA
jgi:inner membrane protein